VLSRDFALAVISAVDEHCPDRAAAARIDAEICRLLAQQAFQDVQTGQAAGDVGMVDAGAGECLGAWTQSWQLLGA
jgi:hypothetical protein